MNRNLTIHEALQLHEILNFKINRVNKAKAYTGLVSDPELKGIINSDITNSSNHLKQLKSLLENETF